MTNDQFTDQLDAGLKTIRSAIVALMDANVFSGDAHLNGALMVLIDAVRGLQERYVQDRAILTDRSAEPMEDHDEHP